MKKMARSASLSPVERFMMNCTYLDAGQKIALYAPAFGEEILDSIRRSSSRRFRASGRRRIF